MFLSFLLQHFCLVKFRCRQYTSIAASFGTVRASGGIDTRSPYLASKGPSPPVSALSSSVRPERAPRRESAAVSAASSRSRSDEILDVAEARSAQHRSSDAIWDAVVECQGAPSPRLAEANAALKAMSLNDSGRESCRDSSVS